MDRLLIALAVALQPTWVREELRKEWIAELAALRASGESTTLFAGRLLRSAPSTAIALRAETNLAFAEFSIAIMFGTFSSAAFATSAMFVDKPDMGLWHGCTAVGSFLLALGLWRDEGGFFGSRLSRTGALLVMIGRGALSTYPIHIPTPENLVARDDIALAVVSVGIAIMGLSQLKPIRSQLGVRMGLVVAAAASLVGGVSDIINLIWLDEPWQVNVALVIAAITSLGVSASLVLVFQRDEIFSDA